MKAPLPGMNDKASSANGPRTRDCDPAADGPGGRPLERIRAWLASGTRKLVVLDDDPTGTQTIHGLDVLTEWSIPSLTDALLDPRPAFFILTNTRALPEPDAVDLNADIVRNLKAARDGCGRDFTIVSRGDSTLRGHFPAETRALARALGEAVDGVVLIPAFIEGGRITRDNVHYVKQGETLVPVAETEFASDATFGFRHSDLTRWVEEKTGGCIAAADVAVVRTALIREGGAAAVVAWLGSIANGRHVVVNAESYADLETFALGTLMAEQAGKRFLYRTAASFVRARVGIDRSPSIKPGSWQNPEGRGGLIVVGSYVAKTTEQLKHALRIPMVVPIEVVVDRLALPEGRASEVLRVASSADEVLANGGTPLVFTSRSQENALGRAGRLDVARAVSGTLVDIVRSITIRPGFIVAKGGITSSDLAVKALGVSRARVLGQIAAGVPVWMLGDESRFPGLSYVVFPGNVGAPETLRDVIVGCRVAATVEAH